MPIWTEITAIRDDIVINVVENNSKSYGKEECKKHNNFIIIYHPYGAFAGYTHTKRDGSIVKMRQSKTRWVNWLQRKCWLGHCSKFIFSCLSSKINEKRTIKTKFKTGMETN